MRGRRRGERGIAELVLRFDAILFARREREDVECRHRPVPGELVCEEVTDLAIDLDPGVPDHSVLLDHPLIHRFERAAPGDSATSCRRRCTIRFEPGPT